MKIPREHKIIIVAEFITAAGLAALWISYFFFPEATSDPDAYRFHFNSTSPWPDILLATVLCISAIFLLRGRDWARRLSLVSALYLIYLGSLDVGIPLGDSVFAVSIIDITSNGALNLWSVVLGLYMVIKLRKRGNPAGGDETPR